MEHIALIVTILGINFLGLISPGPDFMMVIRNSVTYSRRVGFWTALGFSLGVCVHIAYNLFGLAVIISQSIILFNVVKFFGAGYLIFIGLKSFKQKEVDLTVEGIEKQKDLSPAKAIWVGFLTNVLNPKATLFFMSMFAMVIGTDVPYGVVAAVSIGMLVSTVLWFSFVAFFMNITPVRRVFARVQKHVNRVFGAVLVGLGIKVALSK